MNKVWLVLGSFDNEGNEHSTIRPQFVDSAHGTEESARRQCVEAAIGEDGIEDEKDERYKFVKNEDYGQIEFYVDDHLWFVIESIPVWS